jgi:SM-20-related protein
MENELKFETIINGISDKGYGIVDDFIDPEMCSELRKRLLANLNNGSLNKAGIGNGVKLQKNVEIRGDSILWIDTDTSDVFEKKYLDLVADFIQYMNRTCFTGLRSSEIHYAVFPQNAFYKKHVDSFANDKSRQYSLIVYLNENWTDADGGQLKIYQDSGDIEITPIGGRAICFSSHLIPHEVLPAVRLRQSLTGWLKK